MFGIAENQAFLKAIGIANIPVDQKAKLVAGLEDVAQKQLIVKISDRLTEKQANEFAAITDEKVAYEWVMKNIPDFQELVTNVLEDMKNDILAHKMKVVG